MEIIRWEVNGMNCTGCSSTIRNLLESKGMKNVGVDFSTGEVIFSKPTVEDEHDLVKAVESLGFKVRMPDEIKKKGLIIG